MGRRLPVYVLLDCSESMIGPGIEGLRLAVGAMLTELRRNPTALETVWMSFVTFDAEARQVAPLAPLEDVRAPRLAVRPGTALGAALRLTAGAIRQEVKKSTGSEKGDFRPLVFLITDGQPTDEWHDALRELDTRSGGRLANLYAIGCGGDVDFGQLGQITDVVLRLDDVDVEGFAKLFVWLSASVHSASTGLSESDSRWLVELLPEEVTKVDLAKVPAHDGRTRQIFLRASCVQGRGNYLMRFRLEEQRGLFFAVCSHPLEVEAGGGAVEFPLPPVDSRLLVGVPPCPLCDNDVAASCRTCNSLFCIPSKNPPLQVVCPVCKTRISRAEDAESGIRLKQSAG